MKTYMQQIQPVNYPNLVIALGNKLLQLVMFSKKKGIVENCNLSAHNYDMKRNQRSEQWHC
jgi:hypothetical protein